mgnify:CR=1 FL=1
MKVNTKTHDVVTTKVDYQYEAYDGCVFETEFECECYEKALRELKRCAVNSASMRLRSKSVYVGTGDEYDRLCCGCCDDSVYVVKSDEEIQKDFTTIMDWDAETAEKYVPLGQIIIFRFYDDSSCIVDGTLENALSNFESELKGVIAKWQE